MFIGLPHSWRKGEVLHGDWTAGKVGCFSCVYDQSDALLRLNEKETWRWGF